MSSIENTDVLAITRPSGNAAGSYKVTAQDLKAFVGAAAAITVENTLTSASTTNALSAAMGAALKRQLDSSGLSGDSYVRKIGDTMTGDLTIQKDHAFLNIVTSADQGGLVVKEGHIGGAESRLYNSPDGYTNYAGKKGTRIVSFDPNTTVSIAPSWQQRYTFTADGAQFDKRLAIKPVDQQDWGLQLRANRDAHTFVQITNGNGDWEWARIDAQDFRTDYSGRKEVWIRSSQQDQYGFVQLHGGGSSGTPIIISAGSETNRICDIDTGGNWHPVSDRKVKTAIRGIALGLDAVLKMRPCSFRYKAEAEARGQEAPERLGFVAQEMEEVVPEAVKQNEDGLYTLAPTLLIPVLVKAIQELTQRVQHLEGAV